MLLKVILILNLALMPCTRSYSEFKVVSKLLNLNSFTSPSIHPDTIAAITQGVQRAMTTCAAAFKWSRWNCPASAFQRPSPTAEGAYVRAVLAAAVVHQLAHNCSRGDLPQLCRPCKWRCQQDVVTGKKLLGEYLSKEKDMVDLHNYKFGMKIVSRSLMQHCRCQHDPNTCPPSQCRMGLPPFSDISRRLLRHYRQAVLLTNDFIDSRIVTNTLTNTHRLPNKLVYTKESPNYCMPDSQTGWPGTRGRECTRSTSTKEEKRSCNNLCRSCGYSVESRIVVEKNCRCTFRWCCEVICETCEEDSVKYYCV